MLFIQNSFDYLISKNIQQEHYVVRNFLNREYTIELSSSVAGKICTVVGSLTADAKDVLELILLISTLRTSGALKIDLFSPYLGYQRQDNLTLGRLQGLHFADALLHAIGVDQIITIDPHNQVAFKSLLVPIYHYSTQIIFKEEIEYFVHKGFSFIFPDCGAAMRYTWLLEKFPTVACGFFVKKRLHDTVEIHSFTGAISRKVILLDDILDSGQTLVQVCIALRSMGVEKIVIFVTHAFFHGKNWQKLFDLGVDVLYCTNSVSQAHIMNHGQMRIKSIAFLLQKSM